MNLHPAENRGYRELYAFTQQLGDWWARLAGRLDDHDTVAALERGVEAGGRLLGELAERTAAYGLHGRPAASGVGARIASGRSEVADRFLERNQALRLAVPDVHRLRVLLDYLAAVADTRDDEGLAQFCRSWERRLGRIEGPVRRAAVATGEDPDGAIEPLEPSPVGRAAHGIATAFGAAGEWVDGRVADRRSR
jgi:hypothetical protein